MQVYDTVNKLAEEIKTSEEYSTFKIAKQAIDIMPEYKKKIDDFNKLRYEEQLNTMQTGKTDEAKMLNIQNMYKEMVEIPEIKKYFIKSIRIDCFLYGIYYYYFCIDYYSSDACNYLQL